MVDTFMSSVLSLSTDSRYSMLKDFIHTYVETVDKMRVLQRAFTFENVNEVLSYF